MNLQSYVSVVFAASVLGAVCAAFAGRAFETYIRYAVSLACILLIVYPFRSFSLSLPEKNESTAPVVQGETLQSLAESAAKKEICLVIAETLCMQTGISPKDVRIDMEWTEKEAVITAVELVLETQDQTEPAVDWIQNAYGVPCTVVLEEVLS